MYNFTNTTDNAVANFKTTNHMYHRYMELDLTEEDTSLEKLPGTYRPTNPYFLGRVWNDYSVPYITVEHITNSQMPGQYTAECMTLAVENFINFIIQNALFFIQDGK